MPAGRSWFKVHARVVHAQAERSIADLRNPENTAALLDLATVGMDGTTLRHTLRAEADLLSDRLSAQADASAWVDEARAEVRQLCTACFEWRKRLFSRLRYAATCGADPDGSFPRTFGYRKLPRARARGILNEFPALFEALSSQEATLRPHGVNLGFLDEGQLHLQRLQAAQGDLDDALATRKQATAAVKASHGVLRDLLLRLTAADEAAALEFGRPPRFRLTLLAPTPSSGGPAE